MTVLIVGRLAITLNADRPITCGIHGTVIVERRCVDCDQAASTTVDASPALSSSFSSKSAPSIQKRPFAP